MSDTPSSPVPPGALTSSEDNQWGSLAHLGGILGPLPAVIIWLVFRDRGSFTNTEGKEALNFQITVTLAVIAMSILVSILSFALWFLVFFIGFLPWVPWLVGVIFSVLGFLKAKDGTNYRYPMSLRLIK